MVPSALKLTSTRANVMGREKNQLFQKPKKKKKAL